MEIIPVLYEITSSISIILSVILIVIIITKTPPFKKTYKRYLLIYTFQSLMLELCCGLYSPAMLHPYVVFYPLGVVKHLPRNVSMTIFAMQYYHSMSLYDCTIALVLERYYAMKCLTRTPSKAPLYVYSFFAGLSALYLIAILFAIFYQPFHDLLFAMPAENLHIFEKLKDVNQVNTESVIAFHGLEANSIPPLMKIITVLVGLRILVIFILLLLNGLLSQQIKPLMSETHLKNHKMLLQIIILQFIGIFVILVIPISLIIIASVFLSEPSQIISFCFTAMNCFGFYDTVVTAICIKPYRMVFVAFFKKFSRKKFIFTEK